MKREVNVCGRIVRIEGLKKEVEFIQDKFSQLWNIRSWQRTLSNTGGEDKSYDGWIMFGSHPLKDEAGFFADVAAMQLPDPITVKNYREILPEIQRVFDKHVHVIDQRKTSEQRAQEAQEAAEKKEARERAQRERDAANASIFGIYDGVEEMAIPAGFAAVTIQAYFDDSDIMSDYFNRHHSIGGCYVVALVPANTKRTEAIHRSIVDSCPVLSSYKWTWHTEEYSGGNGTYLKSEVVGTAQQHTYAGQDTAPVWLEICVDKYPSKAKKSKLFVDLKSQPEQASAATGEGVTIRINTAQGGVEIKHANKPSQSTIDAIKREGFKWAKYNRCWYKRDSPAARAAAERLTGLKLATSETRDQGGYLLDAMNEEAADNWAAANL